MEKEFDFYQVGKRLPYRTPEGFFKQMQQETMRRVAAEKRRRKTYRLKVYVTAALAAAAILCGAIFLPNRGEETPGGQLPATNHLIAAGSADFMDAYVQQLSDEELQEWIEFSENDIFYELTTENDDYEEN